ncbi:MULTISPECIES: S-layer homology domain-containing protein [unclassified Coleofasciculus]|uniref:S-layer homology domain-containing protein n=1 Tax=unclassified Coleofasciculus TaxID=2692782 RepID=UPI00187FD4DC|nr:MULTISPECIES: S-layer homology domain-containing protein [unclassified Coleofasciculus]MBE9127061.1 S-layer homology domain-containing protein [Coleofasciculus sp. LEGE 07081]MBE9150449.1 S-layer homology domain-containing protein [Coleofasciculus sp. LEGE 07092]
MAQTFYVNPATGNDNAAGSQSAPFKTITKALKQAQTDTTIQLATGTYNTTNGEVFPLEVPSGVKVIGNEGNKGSGILIQGSGEYTSPTLAKQNATLLLANNTELRGVTFTNQASRGTAVWIESTNPTVTNCTFTKCDREGVLATGDAKPIVVKNTFVDNGGNGISFTRNAQGEIRDNSCKKAGYGISIDGSAAPKVTDNLISENRFGIGVSVDAKPILRNNRIENNEEYGLAVTGNAEPNLGKSKQDPGNNIFRNNGKFDVLNSSKSTLVSYGNTLSAAKVNGPITIEGTGTGNGDEQEPITTFPDIQNHWAKPFIEGLLAKGFISGFTDGTFKPDEKMTRAQYAALLVKAFNPPVKRNATTFTDVASDFWAKDVIQQAYRGEFLSGFPNNTFKPNDNVQRVQVIVSLVNGLGLSATDANALNAYSDRTAIPDYAKDEVVTATKKQIAVNYPNVKQLNPTQDATRAEVAAMVYQALVDANQVSAITSPYIVSANQGGDEFADIQNHWAKPFIEGLLAKGFISGFGDGTFKPDEKMNRAQYAALLVKAFNPTPTRDAKNFLDVSDKSWAKEVIQQAYRGGFLVGYPDNTFRQGEKVQRVQVLVSLVNGLGLSENDTNALETYDDRNAIPDYATDEVATATKKQIVVNYPKVKQLNPTNDATRAEVAAMVYQALLDANQVSAINSDYIVSA